MESTSKALLLLEWSKDNECALCKGARPTHLPNCTLDLALAERGFDTQTNRDAARKLLRMSRAD